MNLNLSGLVAPKSARTPSITPKTPLSGNILLPKNSKTPNDRKTPNKSKTPGKTPNKNGITPGKTPTSKLQRSMSMDAITPGKHNGTTPGKPATDR